MTRSQGPGDRGPGPGAAGPSEAAGEPALPAPPWRLEFADGSGNLHRLTQDGPGAPVRWVYDPVTPARSSSGLYSGGPARAGDAAPDLARALWAEAERLAAAPATHAPTRAKGTGHLALETPAGRREVLVAQGAFADLEALVARLPGP